MENGYFVCNFLYMKISLCENEKHFNGEIVDRALYQNQLSGTWEIRRFGPNFWLFCIQLTGQSLALIDKTK